MTSTGCSSRRSGSKPRETRWSPTAIRSKAFCRIERVSNAPVRASGSFVDDPEGRSMEFMMSQHFLSYVLAAALVSTASTSSAVAGTRYVDVSLTTGANDGSSWSDAYQGVDGLANALAAAASGDEIWVAAGTYKPMTTLTRTISITLVNGVGVHGGFAGGETSLAERDPVANPTVLSGDLAGDDGSGIYTENSY